MCSARVCRGKRWVEGGAANLVVQSLLLYCILEGNLNYVSLEIDFVLSAILNRRVPFLFACGSRTFIVETRYQSATGNLVVITAGLCVSERDL